MTDKIFNFFLKIFLVESMVFYVPNEMAYKPQETLVQFSAIAFTIMGMASQCKRKIVNPYLCLFGLYLMLNMLLGHYNSSSVYIFTNIFLGLLLIKIIAEHVELDFKSLGTFFTLFCVFNIFQLTLQCLNIDPIYTNVHLDKMQEVDKTGFLTSRFALGCVAALMVPFMYSAKPFYVLAAVPLIIFGRSSVAAAATVVSFLVMMYQSNKKQFWISLVLLIIAGAVYIFLWDAPSGQFDKRFHVWKTGLMVFRGSPWFGLGLGSWFNLNFVTIQANGEPEVWTWAHNDVFQLMFEAGIFSIIFLWIWLKDLWNTVKIKTQEHLAVVMAFFSMVLISIFHSPFHLARLAGISLFIIGCMEALRHESKA